MTTFEIRPYHGAGVIHFGMSPPDVVEILGQPSRISTNFQKEKTYEYGDVNVGFSLSNLVTHIGFIPGADVVFDGIPIFSDQTFGRLLQLDGDPMEVVGFIVLLNLGIALTGFHDDDESQKALSMFERGEYDELISQMKTFKWNAIK